MLTMALKEHRVFAWLCQEICTIKFRINILKLKNGLLACIMYKMLAEINLLSTITATMRSLRPMNASLRRAILLETKIIKKLAKKDDFLNHGSSGNALSFSTGQSKYGLTLAAPRHSCPIQHQNIARSRTPSVWTASPIRIDITLQLIVSNRRTLNS